MNNDRPFIRHIELHLRRKGLPVWMKIVADGSPENLQILFSVAKTMTGIPNESTITIYNLHPQTRQALMQPELQAELYVGWKNTGAPTLLASGDVVLVVPTKEGTSNQTVLTMFDGYGAIASATVCKTYPPGTYIQAIIFDLVMAMDGVVLDLNKINIGGRVGEKGYSVAGRVSKELDKLANSYSFTWSIQNGVFQVIQDAFASKTRHFISSDSGGLFKAIAQLQDPSQLSAGQIQVGMTITALIQPQILPGDTVMLKSDFVPMYDGDYTVHNITFSGDSHGAQYDMTIESKKWSL